MRFPEYQLDGLGKTMIPFPENQVIFVSEYQEILAYLILLIETINHSFTAQQALLQIL